MTNQMPEPNTAPHVATDRWCPVCFNWRSSPTLFNRNSTVCKPCIIWKRREEKRGPHDAKRKPKPGKWPRTLVRKHGKPEPTPIANPYVPPTFSKAGLSDAPKAPEPVMDNPWWMETPDDLDLDDDDDYDPVMDGDDDYY